MDTGYDTRGYRRVLYCGSNLRDIERCRPSGSSRDAGHRIDHGGRPCQGVCEDREFRYPWDDSVRWGGVDRHRYIRVGWVMQ